MAEKDVVVVSARQVIRAILSVEDIGAISTLERIVAGAAKEQVIIKSADNEVVAFIPEDRILACVAEKTVVARAARDPVVSVAAEHDVVAASCKDYVVARPEYHMIVAVTAIDGIVAATSVYVVVSRCGIDVIGALAAEKRVIASRSADRRVLQHRKICMLQDGRVAIADLVGHHHWPQRRRIVQPTLRRIGHCSRGDGQAADRQGITIWIVSVAKQVGKPDQDCRAPGNIVEIDGPFQSRCSIGQRLLIFIVLVWLTAAIA